MLYFSNNLYTHTSIIAILNTTEQIINKNALELQNNNYRSQPTRQFLTWFFGLLEARPTTSFVSDEMDFSTIYMPGGVIEKYIWAFSQSWLASVNHIVLFHPDIV